MTLSPPEFKTDKFFNLEDKWIQTASNELTHYYDQGEGIPLLMLHGSGSGTSAAVTWWQNMPHLSQSYQTIAFDSIGYGETVTAADSTYGIKQWGDHTLRLMDALNIEKAWLIGSSLGGWTALQLALDHPERICGVVSIGTGGAKKTNKPKPVTGTKPKSTLSAAHIKQDLQKNICNDDLVCDALVNLRYQAALKEQAGGLRPTLLAARDRDRDQFALDFDALAKLTLPVLLIHGMNDKVVPLSRSLELLNIMPTADAHFYSQAGHWPHIGKADEFNDLVSSYIKNNS
ncbi:2-hydroxymuconate semialdehyde hydrolase [Psychrobacter pasteurii]|uniref:2-hydroxymuconate semialdehyde hydrolase n=1 Tax=Psychrobacter pasteurii TaxID=1945520 RepID=A0A1R4EIR1_9GAMM|nr:alpha/beta hydrolase [Psychrobacter pasteurii]SJM38366.1 2-hydroxymuconate semialdehyde hydrolase [Psychrobacter pasteurii]